jgi:hypothetical protein
VEALATPAAQTTHEGLSGEVRLTRPASIPIHRILHTGLEATSTNSLANISPVGPPPAITTALGHRHTPIGTSGTRATLEHRVMRSRRFGFPAEALPHGELVLQTNLQRTTRPSTVLGMTTGVVATEIAN